MMRVVWWCFLMVFFITDNHLFSQVATSALSDIVRQFQPAPAWQIAGEQAMNARFPLIEKVEMRTELDRLLFSRQEYLTRATFNGFKQGKAEKQKMLAFVSWKSAVIHDEWQGAFYKMYSSLVEWQHAVLSLQSLYEEKAMLEKADSLFVQYLENGREIDLVDYTSVKQELLDLQTDIIIARLKWQSAAVSVGADTLEIKTDSWWLHPDQMAVIMDTLKVRETAMTGAEQAYLDASANVLRAESQRWLDFVQARYTVRDDLLLQNRFSVGVGLVVPWKGSSIIKGKEIAFRKEQLSEESRSERKLRETNFNSVKAAFFISYKAYNQHVKQLADNSLQSLKEKLEKSGKVEPVKWLLLKRNDIRRKSELNKEMRILWESYIEALHLSGQMYAYPYVNYLYGLNVTLLPGG